MDLAQIFLFGVILCLCLIILFLSPKISTMALIFFSVFDLGFFSRWFQLSRFFARIPFFIAIILVLRLLFDFVSNKIQLNKEDKVLRELIKFCVLIGSLSVFSLLFHGFNLILGFYELRYYFILCVFTFGIYFYMPIYFSEELFIRFFICISLIQLPFAVIQNFVVSVLGISFTQSSLDIASGTFPTYTSLVFLQCVVLGWVLRYELLYKKPVLRINNYFLFIILLVPLLLSYSRSAVAFVMINIIFVSLKHILDRKTLIETIKMIAVSICVFSVVGSVFYKFFLLPHGVMEQLDYYVIRDYFFRDSASFEEYYYGGVDGIMGRGFAIAESFKTISSAFSSFIFGFGSGVTSEANFLDKAGYFYFKYGPLAGIGRTQLSRVMMEFGVIGVLLFINFFYSIIVFVKRNKSKLILDILYIFILNFFMLGLYGEILTLNIVTLIFGSLLALINQPISRDKIYNKNLFQKGRFLW